MNLSDIRHLFDYTEWANDLALSAAAELSDENLRRDVGISHGSIFGTLLHMAGAEWIWLERWQGQSPVGKDAWSLWTIESCYDLAILNQRWRDVVERRAQFIAELDESRLATELSFKFLSGDPDSLRLVDQIEQRAIGWHLFEAENVLVDRLHRCVVQHPDKQPRITRRRLRLVVID